MVKKRSLLEILLSVIALLVAIAYPFLIYFGLVNFSVAETALFVLVLVAFRLLALGRTGRERWREFLPILLITASVAVCSFFLNSESVLRFNPAAINLVLLLYFFSTFFTDRTFVERVARKMRGEPFPNSAVRYCMKVNAAWCCFFVISASVMGWSALYASRETWVLVTGIGYWIAFGVFVGLEFSFRKIVMEPGFKREEQAMIAAQDLDGARHYAA